MPDTPQPCYYDSEEFAEGERKLEEAARRLTLSSAKFADVARKLAELKKRMPAD